MNTIYWLASYPKSGNTWIRVLLSNYLNDGDEPVNINHLNTGQIASNRAIFDELIGIEASDLTQDEIELWRPLVYQRLAQMVDAPYFVKVHDAFIYTQNGQPLFPKNGTAGALYIMRNPLDVAVSFAHHSNVNVRRIIKQMSNPHYAFVPRQIGIIAQFRQKLLTWGEHVISWVDAPGVPVQIIRYEDLKNDPETTFEEVVRFFGLEVNAERIQKAVQFSTFDRLATQEQEHQFGEKPSGAKSFFRKGEVGSWAEQLTENQVTQIVADHGDVMRRFGYLDDKGRIVY